MDDAIREIERACERDARDGASRLKLAQALVRAGRRREALERLDLATMPDEHFDAGRKLADELWLPELRSLEVVRTIPCPRALDVVIDETGTIGAFTETPGSMTSFLSLDDGAVRHRVKTRSVHGAAGRIFFEDSEERLGCVAVEKDGIAVRVGDSFSRTTPHQHFGILSVSPQGDLVAVSTPQGMSVLEWPGLAATFEHQPPVGNDQCSYRVFVDWTARCIVAAMEDRFEPISFEGRTLASFESDQWGSGSLGRGIFWDGTAVRELSSGRRLGLGLPHAHSWRMSLSSDDRGIRVALEGNGLRCEIDRRSWALAKKPSSSALAGVPRELHYDASIAWHAHADVFTSNVGAGRFELRTLAGEPIVRFADLSRPVGWFDGGHALAVMRDGGASTARLEIWRGRV